MVTRRLPFGAEVQPGGGVHFRAWAPSARRVAVVLDDGRAELEPEQDAAPGWFSGLVPGARAGSRYRYLLDDRGPFPDLASRYQPEGPFGPSEVVDPGAFAWSAADFRGVALEDAVFYELHLGTFTPEGTWASAARELPYLRELGVTVVELMPVAEYAGRFGWGYDGVAPFAPTRLHGTPDDARRFVDAAHALGLGVVLDVVYNHLGPSGSWHREHAPQFFTAARGEWGDALNFDGEGSGPVREYFVSNAGYWIDEFRMDGLRLDATQAIHDASPDHVLAAIGRRAREAAPGRTVLLVAENETQDTRLVRPGTAGGFGLDGAWNDDFHHAARVALTGRREAHVSDYTGSARELAACVRHGYLYQGQRSEWLRRERGTSTRGLPPKVFTCFLENHDQVSNALAGAHLHAIAGHAPLRAMTALLLLGPWTPLLFQGQEHASSAPFTYFADHEGDLAKAVREGRLEFMQQYESLRDEHARLLIPDPADPDAFAACRIDPAERERNAGWVALHRDLLALRRADAALRAAREGAVDATALSERALVVRAFGEDGDDRLLLVNLGARLDLVPASEPLLAAPAGRTWRVAWSSEDPCYGGGGTPPVLPELGWRVPGSCALLLAPARA